MRIKADSAELSSPLDEGEHLASDPALSTPKQKQSRIISTVLSPAIRLWLRSQLEQAENLQFSIEAGDRQLLSGCIKQVVVSARRAVYKGLCLSQVFLVAQEIHTNLRQVLRGQPFRLLKPFPISGEVLWNQLDLNASLQAPLLADGLTEFLLTLLRLGFDERSSLGQRSAREVSLQIPRILIQPGQLTLSAKLVAAHAAPTDVVIRTGISLPNGNQLQLCHPERLSSLEATEGTPLPHLHGVTFDLGSDVSIEDFSLEVGQIRCRGRLIVTPDEG
jgi:hypothetical protein